MYLKQGSKLMKIYTMCLNWNGSDLLQQMLPGLFKNLNNTGLDYHVVIRDNGSKDNSLDILKQFDIEILQINHNRDSFSKGMNSIFNIANVSDNDVILLINNDIIFNDEISLSYMIETKQKSNASICGARLMYEDGTISHNGVIFSEKHNNMPWHFRDRCKVEDKDKKDRYFQAVTAACMLIDVKSFKESCGFDESFIWAFEDVDLNLQVGINQRKKIVCCGKTEITHITSKTLQRNPVNKMFLHKNVARFREKWSGKYKIDHELYLGNPLHNEIK